MINTKMRKILFLSLLQIAPVNINTVMLLMYLTDRVCSQIYKFIDDDVMLLEQRRGTIKHMYLLFHS